MVGVQVFLLWKDTFEDVEIRGREYTQHVIPYIPVYSTSTPSNDLPHDSHTAHPRISYTSLPPAPEASAWRTAIEVRLEFVRLGRRGGDRYW